MSKFEFRIEYTIQRSDDGEEYTDIGFGSSGAWRNIDAALHAADTDIQRRSWETTAGMPEPEDAELVTL